jgi:hypothetical protein
MGGPFEIQLHLAGDKIVTYELTEDEVRERAAWPENGRALVVLNSPDEPDERTRLRMACYEIVLVMVEQFQMTARAHPVSVAAADGVWVMPSESLQAVRLRDPDAGDVRSAFRFVEHARPPAG